MGRGGGRRPVAGDPVEAKKSPVGYPIGLLMLLHGVCQYLPDHIRERLVLFLGPALQFVNYDDRHLHHHPLAGVYSVLFCGVCKDV